MFAGVVKFRYYFTEISNAKLAKKGQCSDTTTGYTDGDLLFSAVEYRVCEPTHQHAFHL